MVEIRIIIEGGVFPNINTNTATISNSEKLREAFHKLLSKVVKPEMFNLIVEIGAGYKNATKSFKKYAFLDNKASLLIDLDGAKSEKEQRLNELEVTELSNRVFFMIQEMEAWILSQPDAIEKCYEDRYYRKKGNVRIVDEELELFKVHPEEIKNPSFKLKVLLGKYYSEMKGNVKKTKKYGKLKDAPLLIENLDIIKLIETFDELKLLKDHITK
jgi:hypothetical protein